MIAPIFLVILYIFVPECACQFTENPEPNENQGKCEIQNITDSQYKAFVKVALGDNETEQIVFTSDYTNKLDVQKCIPATDPDLSKYFTFSKTDKEFQITTTKELQNFDQDTEKQDSDTVSSYMTCFLECPKGVTKVKFQFSIKDINEHAPKFEKDEYTYTVPTPLMPASDLTRYGSSIVVEDLDFSNENVTFKIEPDDFDIKTAINKKHYTALFYSRNVMFLNQSKEYTLTATDTGKDPHPLSSKAKIKLTVDSKTSIDTPIFSATSYFFDYQVKDGKPVLVPKDGLISVESAKFDIAGITLTGEISDKIKYNLNKEKKVIELTLNSEIITTSSYVSFTINMKTDLANSALIVIHMPQVTLEFDPHLITGDYDPTTKSLTMHKNITLKSSGDAKLELSGDEIEYLELKYDKTTTSYSIVLKEGKSIPEKDLKGKTSISLTITATLGEKTDKASVVLYLPINTLKFTNTLYTASYDADKKSVTVDKNPIAFSNKVDAVQITIDEEYKVYFQINFNTTTQQGEVKVQKELSTDILTTGRPLIFEMKAVDNDKNEAKAVLEIGLPKLVGPEFKNLFYEVVYPKDGKGPIDVEFDFQGETEPSKVTINIQDESYKKNFEIEYKDKKWQINIKSPLEKDILKNVNELKVAIDATETGKLITGHAVLIITLPEIKGPVFNESVYIADYPEDGKEIIKFKTDLKFNGDVEVTSIDLSEYQDNFKVTQENKVWVIKIEKPLDVKKFIDKTELVLTMTATEKDNSEKGTATLLIKIPQPKVDGPKFKEAYYTLEYPKDAKSGSSISFSELAFDNVGDETKITVSVGDDFKENFKVTRNESTGNWQMEILKPLDTKIFKEKRELLIIMTAEENGKSVKGTSVLVLKLPSESEEKALTFKKEFYTATYPKTGTGTPEFDSPIEFTNLKNSKDIKITLKEYTDNFAVVYNETTEKWELNIIKALDKDTVNIKNELVIVLEATSTGFKPGTAILVIKIEKETTVLPKFKDSLYEADYPKNEKDNITLDSLDFENVNDKSKVAISINGYEKNFKFKFDTKTSKWYIEIVDPLKNENLQEKSDLRLIMSATIESFTIKAALILNLPAKSGENPPKFENDFYTAEYPKTVAVGDELAIQKDIKFSNVADVTQIQIHLEENTDNFDIIYNNTGKKWVMKVKKLLDITVTAKELVTTIYAQSTEEESTGKAVLVVKLPSTDTEEVPTFSETSYTGDYKKENDKYVVDLKKKIVVSVNNEKDKEKITLKLLSTIKDFNVEEYFKLINGADGYSLSVAKDLPIDILQSTTYLTITLEAELKTKKSTATLLINLPKQDSTPLAKFDKILYKGQYKDKKLNIDTIKVDTDLPDEKVNVQISDESYKKVFKLSYKDKTVKIELDGKLPSGSLISLILDVFVEDKLQSTAVLEIQVTGEQKKSIEFGKFIYNGEYSLQKGNVTILDSIALKTDLTDDEIKVTIEDELDLASYISSSYQNKVLTITLNKAFPSDKLKGRNVLSFTIHATADSLTESASAVLNVQIIDSSTAVITFDKSIYNGELTLTKDAKDFKHDPIVLTVTPASDNVQVSVANEYESFFKIELADHKVKITLKDSADVNKLIKLSNIAVELKATIKDSEATTFAVLNVEIIGDNTEDKDNIAFPKLLYTGIYSMKDGHPKVVVEDIAVVTNKLEKDLKLEVAGDSKEYFKFTFDNKKITLEAIKEIPQDLVRKSPAISLILNVSDTETKHHASTVLIIKIEDLRDLIAFEKFIYSGEYSIEKGNVSILDNINLKTDLADDTIKITITDEIGLADYFSVTYQNKVLTITLKKAFPPDKIKGRNVLSFTIHATADGLTESVSAVLNVEIIDSSSAVITFDKSIYNGQLDLTNGRKDFDHDPIVLTATPASENIQVSVAKEYQGIFKIDLVDQKVKIALQDSADVDKLLKLQNIAVELKATIKDSSASTFAVLNVEIIGENSEDKDNIAFPNLLYNGIYSMKDGHPAVEVDDIVVVTNKLEKDLKLEVKGDSKEYFKFTFANKKITLETIKEIPQNVIRESPTISFILEVSDAESKHHGSTVLNIKIDYIIPSPDNHDGDDFDKTPYIVAICLLAVALVALIVGAVAFYYFKIRRKDYTEVDEEIWKVRFDKSSLSKSSDGRKGSSLEGRRPTGYVFDPPKDDEDENESNTDIPDRRKSVIFDNKVEKREIDSAIDEDDIKEKRNGN